MTLKFWMRMWVVVGVLSIALYGVRVHNKGCQFTDNVDLTGKLVVITGATSGIGLETAKAVAAMNGRLILTTRDHQKGLQAVQQIHQHARGAQVDLVEMDMQSLRSVREAARQIAALGVPVHALINNAGVWMGDRREVTGDGFEVTFAVNHLAHFVFTLGLMERIIEAKGRVVTLSSHMHLYGVLDMNDLQSSNNYAHSSAYASSKIANILFSNEIADRYKTFGVTSVSLHPGVITTNLHREQEKDHPWLTSIFYRTLWPYLGKTPKDGCQTTLAAAFSPRYASTTGVYMAECTVYPSPNPYVANQALGTQLWEESLKMAKEVLGEMEL